MHIEVVTKSSADLTAAIIREANIPIAEALGLEDFHRHPSKMTHEWVLSDMGKREIFFILYDEHEAVGTVSYKSVGGGVAFLARLAVRPKFQHRGYGVILVKHLLDYSKKSGDRRVDLGVIESSKKLIAWYQRLGFVIKNSKSFKHLPFKVTFMRRVLV